MPMSMPCDPSLYCGLSSKTSRFSAFRFWYNANNRMFRVDEIKIENSSVLSEQLPPDLYYVWRSLAVGRFGRVYSIEVGVDDINAVDYLTGNRYVKVNAAQVKPKSKSKKMEKENDENVPLKRCRTMNNQGEDGGEFKMSEIWSRSFLGSLTASVSDDMSVVAFALY